MSDGPLFSTGVIHEAYLALRKDLLADGGPRISTMRNHRFAIWVYPPSQEFELRQAAARLADELRELQWHVLDVSLQKLVLAKIASLPEDLRRVVRDREVRFHVQKRDPERALNALKEQLSPVLEGPDGIARDVTRALDALVAAHPQDQDRSLVFLSRAQALYPFTRSGSLLKHIADHTHHVPVILLYPGEQRDGGLSFLGQLKADRDYRPRIYPQRLLP